MSKLKHRQLLAALQTGYTTCEVKFENTNRHYTYKIPLSWDLQPRDQIIVESPTSGYTIVEVQGVHDEPHIDFDGQYSYKWAVCKVDDKQYKQIAEWELTFLKKLEQLERKQKRTELQENVRRDFALDGWKAESDYDNLVRELEAFNPLIPRTRS